MPALTDWLTRVLGQGESVQSDPPELVAADRPAAIALLREAFDAHALDVAEPPVAFDPAVALGAAVVLARACWRLVGDDQTADSLAVGCEPATPAAHLSADVTLRFLPAVYRRAAARDLDGPLKTDIERLLRQWPLSGVLADLDGEPAAPPAFGGHPGLQQLYAERLTGTGRAGWVPPTGSAREWVERVFSERRRPLPAAITIPSEAPGD
jgi:hypothetical protein